MSDNEGILLRQYSGRWAVCRPGREPIEITGGDLIRVDVEGELKVTRMEFRHFTAPMKGQTYYGLPGEYYSVDGYWLRAAIGAEG